MKKTELIFTLIIFASASCILYLVTNYLIPYLSKITGQETVLFWFLCGGCLVFLPLGLTAIVIVKKEGHRINSETLKQRLRFKKLTRNDLIWVLIGVVSIGVLSFLIMTLLELIAGKFEHTPPFMSFEPLTAGRYWLLAVWLPYWILNIMCEEILWRGVLLPLQELAIGKYAWFIHGLGWGLFHISFGTHLLITLLPILFILPYIVQKTGNTWTGVILHSLLNGPSFIAISLGMLK